MSQAVMGLLVRGIMQSVGGALAANGVVNASDTEAFVQIGTGIIVNVLAYVWSYIQKKRSGAIPPS